MPKNTRSRNAGKVISASKGVKWEIPLQDIPVVNPNNIQSVYTNNVIVMNAPFDIRLVFNEMVSEGLGKPVQAVLRANVCMTPAHAKALADALTGAVEQYKEIFGEIPWPPKQIEKREVR
jgi:hypothetical protein